MQIRIIDGVVITAETSEDEQLRSPAAAARLSSRRSIACLSSMTLAKCFFFSESPHKTLICKSLAEISPLAKLPSQAFDFQMQRFQSVAQHGTSLGEEEVRGRETQTEKGALNIL